MMAANICALGAGYAFVLEDSDYYAAVLGLAFGSRVGVDLLVVPLTWTGRPGDEGGYGHLFGAGLEEAFDLTDVGAVCEEDGDVGAAGDLQGHGGSGAAVDDALN
jgi:hypothetical protein